MSMLKQLITLHDLQVAHQECEEFDTPVTKLHLSSFGDLCTSYSSDLKDTPHIAVHRSGEVYYHYGQTHKEHVLTLTL